MKQMKLCCGRAKCPKISLPKIREDGCYGDDDYFVIKDDFGGEAKITKEQLDYLVNQVYPQL